MVESQDANKEHIPFSQRPTLEGSIGRNIVGAEIDPASRRGKIKKALIEHGHLIGSTRETNIPGTSNPRGIVERFERGELFRVYMQFRRKIKQAESKGGDAAPIRIEFDKFRAQARIFKKNLDVLNRQFYPYPDEPNKWNTVNVKDDELGEHNIPVITLDLNPPKEGEKDERIPYFLVPTYIANPYQVAFIAMSLALEGQRVHVMTYPEKYKMSKSPKDWIERVRNDKTLRLYAKLAKKIVENMGIDNINLIGTSMGAAVVLEMAQDQEFNNRINDLISVDPPGLFKRSTGRMLWDFGSDTVPPGFFNREIGIKAAKSERKDLEVSMGRGGGWIEAPFLWAPIIAREHITSEDLANIRIKGNFQIWVGGDSKITGERGKDVLTKAQLIRAQEPGVAPLQIFLIEGASHLTMFSTLGMAEFITQKPKGYGNYVRFKESGLASAGAQAILRGKQFYSPPKKD